MLTHRELKKIIKREYVGDQYPFYKKSSDAVEEYVKSIVLELNKTPLIKAEANYAMYGTGYTSYIDIFCFKRDGSSTSKSEGTTIVKGIEIYISRLAPVAIWGKSEKHLKRKGSSYDFLCSSNLEEMPEGDWDEVLCDVQEILRKSKITFLKKEYVTSALPFKAQIPSLLKEEQQRILDAIFYLVEE